MVRNFNELWLILWSQNSPIVLGLTDYGKVLIVIVIMTILLLFDRLINLAFNHRFKAWTISD